MKLFFFPFIDPSEFLVADDMADPFVEYMQVLRSQVANNLIMEKTYNLGKNYDQ